MNKEQNLQNAETQALNIPVVSTSLFVGQTVWYKELQRKSEDKYELIETKIAKIGKKYFETETKWLGRFYIDSMKHDAGQYSARYQVYLNKEQHENEIEADKIYSELRNIFSSYGKPTLELSKLREILSIVRS